MSLQTWRGGHFSDDGPSKDGGLKRYARVLREQWMLILGAVVISVVAAAAFSLSASKTYEAEAILEVTPVSDDGSLTGISVIRESSDPTRDMETLARSVDTDEIYEEAIRLLEASGGVPAEAPIALALPIANSFLISIASKSTNAEEAARVATAFATAVVNVRKAAFENGLALSIERLRTSLQQSSLGIDARASIEERLASLRSLRGGPDPSVNVLTGASVPLSPSSPGLRLVLFAGALVGLFWGSGAALIADSLLSRVRRDAQLLQIFGLPILARVPKAKGPQAGLGPLGPLQLDPAAMEGYRTLRQNIEVLRRSDDTARSVVFTSSEPSDGKTTSAVNTAVALAESGYRVLLIDSDLRRPSVGKTLSLASPMGTTDVLAGRATLEEAVIAAPGYGGNLSVLLADPVSRPRVELLTKAALEQLMQAAQSRWDFIVFDTAPLAVVADALPIATAAHDVFVTVRRGHTRLDGLRRLIDTLNYHNVTPRGFVLVGAERDGGSENAVYYQNVTALGSSGPAAKPARRGRVVGR